MGLVAKQTFYNLLSIGLAFIIGALNTLYMFPNFMGSRFQGVVIALLAYSNLVQPFISFGLQHAVIKYYSSFKTKQEKDSLLVFTLWSPLLVIILILIYLSIFSSSIITDISSKEPLISTYAYVIILIAISTVECYPCKLLAFCLFCPLIIDAHLFNKYSQISTPMLSKFFFFFWKVSFTF